MAEPTFPSEFLPNPEARNYEYVLDTGLRRTDMGSGNARQRRKFNNLPQMYRLSWLVNLDQKKLLLWFLDRFANQYFKIDLVTPNASSVLTTARIRLTGKITERYVDFGSFRISGVFEALETEFPDPDISAGFLLKEDGDYLLKEDGGRISLETANAFFS